MLLRHDNVEYLGNPYIPLFIYYLEQAKDLILLIEKELEKPVSLKFYSDVQSALVDGKKLSAKSLQKGDSIPGECLDSHDMT